MTIRITNFGSCSIDNVYSVPRFAAPGETLPTGRFDVHPGGKGLNQSIALARAGANVRHAGRVGRDGEWLKQLLLETGVDTELLKVVETTSGHAVIQVVPEGENSIVIFGGANREIDEADIDAVITSCEPGEFLLLQNEISGLEKILRDATHRDLRVVFNAAPMTADVLDYPLGGVEFFVINETEGAALTGSEDPEDIIDAILARYPGSSVILTLGKSGVIYGDIDQRVRQVAFEVEAVDATGAGDTFTGYFLAGLAADLSIEASLEAACRAAAHCVTRSGAASSIPTRGEINQANSVSR